MTCGKTSYLGHEADSCLCLACSLPLWLLYLLRPLHLSFLVSPHLPPPANDFTPYLVMSVWTGMFLMCFGLSLAHLLRFCCSWKPNLNLERVWFCSKKLLHLPNRATVCSFKLFLLIKQIHRPVLLKVTWRSLEAEGSWEAEVPKASNNRRR